MRAAFYRDREDAGQVLAELLQERLQPPCVVAGIPRGGVLVARPIAQQLGCPLTVTFVRKLTLPMAPELAIGALGEDGQVVIDHGRVQDLGASADDLQRVRARVTREIQRQKKIFSAPELQSFLPRSTVVLVDDGLATGHTMKAALAHARGYGAKTILIAVPCASLSAAQALRREADGFVCPRIDSAFRSVGAYYRAFSPVTDEEVIAVLDESREGSRHHVS